MVFAFMGRPSENNVFTLNVLVLPKIFSPRIIRFIVTFPFISKSPINKISNLFQIY